MHRRQFISKVSLGSAGAISGCTTVGPGTREKANEHDYPVTRVGTGEEVGLFSVPVSEDDLVRGATKDAIPAITEPVFGESWEGLSITVGLIPPDDFDEPNWEVIKVNPRLEATDKVIGVEREREARAYPIKALNWFMVVNDTFHGPLLVTYDPLCGCGMTAVRRVNRQETVFGVSGLLFRNNLVMYDALTETLWSQIQATGIKGPNSGETLKRVDSTLTTWGAWQESHDSSVVLRPPPESNTVAFGPQAQDYSRHPYPGYEESRQIGLGGVYHDERIHPKAIVLGIEHGGVVRAYPFDRVESSNVVNDLVGGMPVVIAVAPGGSLVGYDRRVARTVFQFEESDARHLFADESRWQTATGQAVDGPHRGTRLRPATASLPSYFFAWKNFHPETEVYGSQNYQTGSPDADDIRKHSFKSAREGNRR